MSQEQREWRNEQCSMYNLNWGYQIVDPKLHHVIMAIKDTQDGPQRSEACTATAHKQYERITKILALHNLTTPCRGLLIELIKADGAWIDTKGRAYPTHWNTVKPLLRRGLATRNRYDPDSIRLSDEYLREMKTDIL